MEMDTEMCSTQFLFADIRFGSKGLAWTNALAYLSEAWTTKEKRDL